MQENLTFEEAVNEVMAEVKKTAGELIERDRQEAIRRIQCRIDQLGESGGEYARGLKDAQEILRGRGKWKEWVETPATGERNYCVDFIIYHNSTEPIAAPWRCMGEKGGMDKKDGKLGTVLVEKRTDVSKHKRLTAYLMHS